MDRIGILIKKASLELEKTALSILSQYDMLEQRLGRRDG